MAAITVTTLNEVLKELYNGQTVEQLAFDAKARPFFSMLKKNTNFEGKYMPIPIAYDDAAGRSVGFAVAQGNVTDRPRVAFDLTVVENYCVNTISTKALRAARSNKGAFLNSLKDMTNGVIEALSNDIERSLFGDGVGTLATIAADGITGGSKTITLATAKDAMNFVEGMSIVAADTTASALRSSTPSIVESVDYVNGTVAVTTAITAGCDAYDGDLLFAEGDYDSANDANKLKGLAAWLPSTAPSASESFFGIDRSANPVRLAGVRYAGSAGAIQETLIKAASTLCGYVPNAMPDVCLMSFENFQRLVLELDSQVTRNSGGKATGGFQSVEIYGPKGLIKCVPSTFCPDDRMYLLTSNTWEFVSMDSPVGILNDDGLMISRVYNQDAWEVRCATYSQLACKAPGKNCVITLT